jgi:ATP-dependent DNA helicase RecG
MPLTDTPIPDTLTQAIAFEIQHAYTDVQGRQQQFSGFMRQQLKQLRLEYMDDEDLNRVATLFTRYPLMDMGQRMQAVKTLLAWLDKAKNPQPSVTKSQSSEPEQTTPVTLVNSQTDVSSLKGVGPYLSRLLNSIGLFTVYNLVHYFPRKYIDYLQQLKIAQLQVGQDITVIGKVRSVGVFELPKRPLLMLTLVIADSTGQMAATWFFSKAQRKLAESQKTRYPSGTEVMMSGHTKWDNYRNQLVMERPQVEVLSTEADQSLHAGRIVPIYPLTQGLYLKSMRRCMFQALTQWVPTLSDPMPTDILTRYSLAPLGDSYWQIHFPQSMQGAEQARRRLVFDELFCIQANLYNARLAFKQAHASQPLLPNTDRNLVAQGRQILPFSLTQGQETVLADMFNDMAQPQPMFRLLQGDVGSGKTVVAWLAMLRAVENGYQAALMAPTEILAEQHYQRFVQWLTPLGLRAGLFVGKATARQRKTNQEALENGQIHIAVGTHALIQDGLVFQRLGIVIIDEQHRFGVKQRTLLRSKGQHPHMLAMTATPIPRTLALTLYGDLDVSILRERPPGRSPIITEMVTPGERKRVFMRIREQVMMGRQVYVVFPLIEESETLTAKAATTEAETLQHEIFPEFRVGLLHGRLPSDEKAAVMEQFVKNQLHIMVSTTVIEVGVDVPNATIMWIESAERFGLSQLHQLRGRVGRGQYQSYCFLALDSKTVDAQERMAVMEKTEDGFEIAEHDLALRGPGEFLGTRQSGLPDLLLADLIADKAVLEQAREAAETLYTQGHLSPELTDYVNQKTQPKADVLGAG